MRHVDPPHLVAPAHARARPLDKALAGAVSSRREGGRSLFVIVLVLASLATTRTAFSSCGDTVIDAAEECDDGNTLLGDCSLPDCRHAPYGAPCGSEDLCDAVRLGMCDGAGTCLAGETAWNRAWWCGARIALRDEVGAAEDRLRVKTIGGRFGVSSFGITPERLGDPAGDTRYALCGYDAYMPDISAVLLYGVVLAPQSKWAATEGGFTLRDGDRNPLRRATVTQKRLRIIAEGAALPLPGAVNANEYFNPPPRFFFVSLAGLCAQIGPTSSSGPSHRNSSSRTLRAIGRFVVRLVLGSQIALATLLLLLQTGPGATLAGRIALSVANPWSQASATIESASLSWLTSLELRNVRIEDSTRSLLITIDTLRASYSLRALLNGSLKFWDVELRKPIVRTGFGMTGSWALIEPFQPSKEVETSADTTDSPLVIACDRLTLTDGAFAVVTDGGAGQSCCRR